jgi:hypothetical protein
MVLRGNLSVSMKFCCYITATMSVWCAVCGSSIKDVPIYEYSVIVNAQTKVLTAEAYTENPGVH